PSRWGCRQPIPDLRIDACGISQGQQQIFLEVPAEMLDNLSAGLLIEIPVIVQAQLKRGIVPGRDEKVQLPVIDIGGGRLLQAEAEGKTGPGVCSGEVRAPDQPLFVVLQCVSWGLRQGRSVRIDKSVEERVSDFLVEF